MLHLLITIGILLNTLVVDEQQTCDLNITIENFKNTDGQLIVALFDNEENFLKKEYQIIVQKLGKTKSETIIFRQIPRGKYSVSVFHDENENGKLDKNTLGIPTEKFGFSNNAFNMFGPPKFNESAINLTGPQTEISISLKSIL